MMFPPTSCRQHQLRMPGPTWTPRPFLWPAGVVARDDVGMKESMDLFAPLVFA